MTESHVQYDEPSDTLYVLFGPRREATGLELSDQILLRVDRREQVAVGLTILNYSVLAQSTEIGPRSVALSGLRQLPIELQELALRLLKAAPVRDFLALSVYTPEDQIGRAHV